MTFAAVFPDRRRSNRTLGLLQGLSPSGGHKQAQYDYQIYRELQGKARLQAKSYSTTNEFTKLIMVNGSQVLKLKLLSTIVHTVVHTFSCLLSANLLPLAHHQNPSG